MSKLNNSFKKPIQVYLNKVEWNMLEGLFDKTGAETMPDVLRAALVTYYGDTMEKLEKEAKSDG